MSDLGYVAFEIPDAPVGSGGSLETGRFEIYGSAEGEFSVTEEIVNEPLVDSRFSQVISVLQDVSADGASLFKGITIDRGGGVHTISVQFENPGLTEKPGGGVCQWGSSTSTSTVNAHTATGGTKKEQQAVLFNYLRKAPTDSLTPATLYFNEYHSGGVLSPLDVRIVDPTSRIGNGQSVSRSSFEITFAATADLNEALDAAVNNGA